MDYLCFSCENGQTQTFSFTANASGAKIEYSVDNANTWNPYTSTITFGYVDGLLRNLYIRGKNPYGTALEDLGKRPPERTMPRYARIRFGYTDFYDEYALKQEEIKTKVQCSGDIRSLIDYEDIQGCDTSNARFTCLFEYNLQLEVAPTLGCLDLADECYKRMFAQCTSLSLAPQLPARNLSRECYREMFYQCTSLVLAPDLPSGLDNEKLTYKCYYRMFYGCKSLVLAPQLPAKDLAEFCYGYMFSGCTSLNYVKMLADNISEENTYHWLYNVYPVGFFIKSLYAQWKISGCNGIPEEWTCELADS